MQYSQFTQRLKKRRVLLFHGENEWLSFPVLTAVQVVCRRWLPLDGDQSLARIIDAFLDEVSGSISLSTAYETSGGSLRLLQYLTSHESPTTDPILHRWEFNNVTGAAAAQGDLVMLQWLVEIYHPEYNLTQVVAEAAWNGHLHILEWLWENHRSRTVWGRIDLCLIKDSYHHDVIHWLRARTEIPPEHAQALLQIAAENGDVKLVRELYNRFQVEIDVALCCAMEHRHWEIVYWILDNCKLVDCNEFDEQHTLCYTPIMWGNLDMLKLLFDRGLVLYTANILGFAAECGQLHIVKWLHEMKGFTRAGYGYDIAVRRGHLDVVEYLSDKKEIVRVSDEYIMDEAVSLKMIQWFHFHTDAKCSHQIMDEAAARGDLETVQWLHDNRSEGCSSGAMHRAAKNGHLAVVKWLHANRSEDCLPTTMWWAAHYGHLEIVKWLHANSTQVFDISDAMDSAARNGNLELLQWFHENRDGGCTTEAMDSAASCGYLEVVKWLHHHRSEGCTTKAMDKAVENGHLEVVKWLHWNRSEGCTQKAIDKAATRGRMKVVKWLHANRSLSCTASAIAPNLCFAGRLDVVAYLVSEFPECRNFSLKIIDVSQMEVVEWLLANTPNALDGCALRVRTHNRYICEWLRQNHWRAEAVQDEWATFILFHKHVQTPPRN